MVTHIGGPPVQNFVMKDNILYNNEYGVHCQTGDYSCFPNLFNGNMQGNVIIGPAMPYRPTCGNPYPTGNYCLDKIEKVGFINGLTGNFRLAESSPYKAKSTDGKAPGVDMDKLTAALAGGIQTSSP